MEQTERNRSVIPHNLCRDELEGVSFSETRSAVRANLKTVLLGVALTLFGSGCKSLHSNESLGSEALAIEASTDQIRKELSDELSSLVKTEVEKALNQRMQHEQERLMREVVSNLILRTKSDQSFTQTLSDALTGWEPDCEILIRDVLHPVVRLSGPSSVGSGVILSSTESSGQYENRIITNWHVVRDALEGANPSEKSIEVEVFQGGTRKTFQALCIAYDISRDLALVRFSSDQEMRVAKLASTESAAQCRPFQWVAAVGCPVGDAPYPTLGIVGDVDEILDGDSFIQISAPTYVGNSGGGVFDLQSRELIGVYAKIYTSGFGGAKPIPHMGLAIPIRDVHNFLEANKTAGMIAKN